MRPLFDNVRATMKSQDTEGRFELYVTRTPGYLWALLFRALHIHPIVVTLASILLGALSGWCFYFEDIRMTLTGILLLVWANWYDCADGQLARMTGKKTLIGRILDGFAGDVWFFCIYLFICLRMTPTWGIWIWLLAAWAGLRCHGRQCAIADYYRNVHLFISDAEGTSELTSSASEKAKFDSIRWVSKDWFQKLYLFFYVIYTKGQEDQCPKLQRLLSKIREVGEHCITTEMRRGFRQDSLPLMPLTNILTFDTRAAVLFASLLAGSPWVYFIFESTVLEGIRYWMIHRHETFCQKYYKNLTNTKS